VNPTVTTTASTASIATAITQRRIDPPRAGICTVGCKTPPGEGAVESKLDRSASLKSFGASGVSPLCTRIRSVRMSAALWYRFSGFLASALSTTASSSGEMASFRFDGRTGSLRTCW
jgi:hypothetical protein